jgi:hypothetical protein
MKFEARITKIEQLVGCHNINDSRSATYPNSMTELMIQGTKNLDEWQLFCETRSSRPNPDFYDWVEKACQQAQYRRNHNLTDMS